MKRNRYKLVSGHWARWEGKGKVGAHVRYTTKEGSNIVENVTPGELEIMGTRLVLVAGTSAAPAVPALPEIEEVDEAEVPDAEEDGEPTSADGIEMDVPSEEASWADIVNAPLKEVVASINVIEDLDDLAALRKEEMKKGKRKGVLSAIEDRKTVLKAGG